MYAEGLGRLFDIGVAVAPVDLDTANAATGKRISMSGALGCTIVVFAAAGAADDLIIDLQQHTAYTGGTTDDLEADVTAGAAGTTDVDRFYIKSETLLDNDEAWTLVSNTTGAATSSELTLAGATYGAVQKLVAIYVGADYLADGYTHLSINLACVTAATLPVAALYILHDLHVKRGPANLPNLLNPGAVNA